MKFSDLTNNQRAILNALASTNKLQTDALGRCCNPKLNPPTVANVLCSMREQGLIYSHAKLPNASYCDWVISTVGMAVFAGRPDGEVKVVDVEPVNSAAVSPGHEHYLVKASEPGRSFSLSNTTQDVALAEATRHAERYPGTTYEVFKKIAVAELPVPKAQLRML